MPSRTLPDDKGKPKFHLWGDDGPPRRENEIRRHVYRSAGRAVRIKVKSNPERAELPQLPHARTASLYWGLFVVRRTLCKQACHHHEQVASIWRPRNFAFTGIAAISVARSALFVAHSSSFDRELARCILAFAVVSLTPKSVGRMRLRSLWPKTRSRMRSPAAFL